eukprot:721962-Amphidinium_carterae.2
MQKAEKTASALAWHVGSSSWRAEGNPLPNQVTVWLSAHAKRVDTKCGLALDEHESHDDKIWPIVKNILAPTWAGRSHDVFRASAALKRTPQ